MIHMYDQSLCHNEQYYLQRCAASIIFQHVNKLCTSRATGGIGLS